MPPSPATFDIFPALHLGKGRLIDFAPGGANGAGGAPFPGGGDPLAAARHWIEQGATWLHVIDVEALFDETAEHHWSLIEALCALGAKVQYGGGLRDADDIRRAMRAGVDRVLLGTAAIESPILVSDAIAEHGRERFALAIRTDPAGDVLVRGAQPVGGLQAAALALQMYRLGIGVAVHTRLEPDGTMTGTDLDSSRELASLSGMDVVVGGEVRDMDDVVACYNRPGITGVLIGKALQSGAIDLGDAIAETRATLAVESGLPRWKAEQSTLKARLRHALSQRFLARHLPSPEGLHVLDAGGGTGTDSLPLAAAGARVELVDRSLAMLEDFHGSAEVAGVTERVAGHALDIRQIPHHFAPDSVDVVLAHGVIQYSRDWQRLLTAMTTPLKSGGLFSLVSRNWFAEPYAIDPGAWSAEELPALLERSSGPSAVFDADVLFFSAGYLGAWLQGHGFDIVADYGLLCRHELPPSEGAGAAEALLGRLVALESAMGERSPFKDTARYVQIVARKR